MPKITIANAALVSFFIVFMFFPFHFSLRDLPVQVLENVPGGFGKRFVSFWGRFQSALRVKSYKRGQPFIGQRTEASALRICILERKGVPRCNQSACCTPLLPASMQRCWSRRCSQQGDRIATHPR